MPAHVKLQAVKQLLAKVNSIAKAMEAKANSSTSRSRDRYDFTMHPLDPERPHQSFEVVPPNRAQPSVRWSGTGEAGDEGAFSFFPFTFSPVGLAAVDVERDGREIERQETRAKAQGQAKAKAKTERRTGQAFPFPVVYRHELKRWRKLAAVCPYIDKGDKSQCTATIKYERPGRYYVILTYLTTKQPLKAEQPCSHASVVALDPGVRVFQTTYDLQGRAWEFGRTSQQRTDAQREAQRRERRRRQRWRKRQKEKGTEQQKERRRRQKERKRRRGKEAEMEASTPTTGTEQQRGRADDRSRAESGRASAPDEGEEEKEKAWVVQVQRSSSPLAEPELERPSQPARLQGPIDDVGTGEREEETTPSVRKRKNKVKRVNKRRGAARLYALALRIDQLQSDLATGAHLQRLGLGVVPSSNPASDTSTSPSSPTATTTSTSSSSSPTSPTSSPTSSPTTSPTFPTSPHLLPHPHHLPHPHRHPTSATSSTPPSASSCAASRGTAGDACVVSSAACSDASSRCAARCTTSARGSSPSATTTSSSRRSARRRWCRRAARAGASTRSPCARCSAGLTTASVSACSSRRSCAGRRCTSCPRPTRPSRAAAAVDCTTRWAAATRSAVLTLPATTAASETRTAPATSWR